MARNPLLEALLGRAPGTCSKAANPATSTSSSSSSATTPGSPVGPRTDHTATTFGTKSPGTSTRTKRSDTSTTSRPAPSSGNADFIADADAICAPFDTSINALLERSNAPDITASAIVTDSELKANSLLATQIGLTFGLTACEKPKKS